MKMNHVSPDVETKFVHYKRLDLNLVSALEEQDYGLYPYQIKSILMQLDGQDDSINYHWIVELFNSDLVAYITGGPEYSGWDCGGGVHIDYYVNLKSLLEDLVPDARNIFEDMLKNGETYRRLTTSW
jgi:SPX domain protein involved in polyphosphate accumulation